MMSKAVRLLFEKQRASRIRKEGNLLNRRKRKGTTGRKADTKKGKIMEVTTTDKRVVDDSDRISELPDHILHHILHLLRWPKDLARTSIWSKKWKAVWESFSSFDFDQTHFQGEKVEKKWNHLQPLPVEKQSPIFKQVFERVQARGDAIEKFILFVENALATRLQPLPSIQKFRLRVSCFSASLLAPFMDQWIGSAIDKNVKELEIHVPTGAADSQFYALPQVILSSRTITSLKLCGSLVVCFAAIKLQNLRELSMKMMRIDDNAVQDFVQGCPVIEDIRVINCHGFRSLHVPTLPRLNRLEVHEGSSLRSIKVEAPNLEMFTYHGKKTSRCKLLLEGCGNLKSLTLRHKHLVDKLFQERISWFPLLESLFLLECHALQRITILSNKLKRLSLIRCHKLKEANIDAPNLLSFEYNGGAELPFWSMNASRLQEVKLHLKSQQQHLHPLEVQKFVQGFYGKGFSLFLASKQEVNIYEELSRLPLLSSKIYRIELTKSARMLGNLLKSHLRDFHPKTLNLYTSRSSDLLVFVKEEMMNREKCPSCCRYYSNKCWRHYLEDVDLFEFSEYTVNPTASAQLKWRSPHLPLPEDEDVEMAEKDTNGY